MISGWEICHLNEIEDDNFEYMELSEQEYRKNICYDTIKTFTDLGMEQINIHAMISENSYENILELLNDKIANEPRLEKLNAIVFLSLKKKGRACNDEFQRLSDEHFSTIIKMCLDNDIPFGMDSCTAQRCLKELRNNYPDRIDELERYVEPCEASIYSSYINVNGYYSPCSFIEGTENWETGLNVLECEDFIKDIWNNKLTKEFRNKVINCRTCNSACPVYDI